MQVLVVIRLLSDSYELSPSSSKQDFAFELVFKQSSVGALGSQQQANETNVNILSQVELLLKLVGAL